MFIELWSGLRDLYHDNTTLASKDDAKRFINWSIRDIANEYDWEFLRGSKSQSVTANGTIDLNSITQLTGVSAAVYGIASATADEGVGVTIHGKYLNVSTSAFSVTSDGITVSAALTASGSQAWSHIDAITKPITSDGVYITNGTTTIATLGASDTYVANDIKKINSIIDSAGDRVVKFMDYNSALRGDPNSNYTSGGLGYDVDYKNVVKFYNVPDAGRTVTILYQRQPLYLINDYDRTEFPEDMYADITNYAYKVYGKQYQDEGDNIPDTAKIAMREALAGEIIRKWTMGKDRKQKRIMPRNMRRTL